MRKQFLPIGALAALLVVATSSPAEAQDLFDRVEHHYADSDGTSIHYVTVGEGPLVVMIHGSGTNGDWYYTKPAWFRKPTQRGFFSFFPPPLNTALSNAVRPKTTTN